MVFKKSVLSLTVVMTVLCSVFFGQCILSRKAMVPDDLMKLTEKGIVPPQNHLTKVLRHQIFLKWQQCGLHTTMGRISILLPPIGMG
jgi:hypothetical protein